MTVYTATLPGRSNNQDRYIIGDGFAAVLDGATSVAGDRSHDPGWFAELLAQAIGETVPQEVPLADAVEEAIRTVSVTHRLTPETTPTSTVALARWSKDRVETYVLGDSYAVILYADETEVVHTDDRLDGVAMNERRAYKRRLADGYGYDDGHRALMLDLQTEQARRCNKLGGYWIAGADPDAAQHGFSTTERRSGVTGFLLASDGVDLARHPTAESWTDVFHQARAHGADQVLLDVHNAEESDPDGRRWPRSKHHDDKTLVAVSLTTP